MKYFKLYILLLSFSTIAGCKKYLEEEPSRNTAIKTVEQLEGLMNNTNIFRTDGSRVFIPNNATDHAELPSDWPGTDDIFAYTFSMDGAAVNNHPYNQLYSQIFTANVVLTYADEVDGDEALKKELKAGAYFYRAYNHWYLANHYCLPYARGKNENELGITLKRSTSYEEPARRATLKQTYDFILSDLNEAMKTPRDEVDPKMPWRVSKKAVAAFLSRVQLGIGNYDEALAHANTALASTTAQLVDFRTIKAGPVVIYKNPADTLRYSELYNWFPDQWLFWQEFYLPRTGLMSTRIPSPGLLSLYDTANDLRFKWFMIPKFNRVRGSSIPYYGYFGGFGNYVPTGPTVAEMLLNKAEVLARKGDVDGAMEAVNTLRAKRMNTPAPLSATDKDDAIKKVLDERRREMPFAMRWFDLRRFSVNDYPADDVTVTRTWWKVTGTTIDRTATQTYTLAPGDRKWAFPIPNLEIEMSNGAVQQNTY